MNKNVKLTAIMNDYVGIKSRLHTGRKWETMNFLAVSLALVSASLLIL